MKRWYLCILLLGSACRLSGGSIFSKVSGGQQEIEILPSRRLTLAEQANKKELDALYNEFRKTHPQQQVDLEKIKQRRKRFQLVRHNPILILLGELSAGLLGVYAVASIINQTLDGPAVHARQALINSLAQGCGSLVFRIMTGIRFEGRNACRVEPEKNDISFNDLAGPIPQQLESLLQCVAHRDFYHTMLNITLPRGVLLYGNVGSGKTLLVKALAQKLNAAFFILTPAHIFTGNPCESTKRIEDFFAEARWFAHAGSVAVIFIDRVDAFCGMAESASVLNELLRQIQSISPGESILVFGATNKPAMLDQEFLQAGFERHIGIPLPDEEKRRALLTFYAQKCPRLSGDIDYDELVEKTKEFSCADIAALVQEALYGALSSFAVEVRAEYFQQACKKIGEQIQARYGALSLSNDAHGIYS